MLWTIEAASEALRGGRSTPRALLDSCFRQIERYESRIRAWVFIDRELAFQQAEAATAEIQQGHWRGPLHGIPLGIKDIYDVFDWPTAAGSPLWANSIARRNATVVERLRQAGAVLMGKTVTTQYASFDPSPTRNPWNIARTPGGSSSGSAAAVACGMCLGALGSQTGGSITRPASYCGIAGCKPTYGRVSVDGVVPLAFSMDHPGPMAGCVRDLAIILKVIGGPDPRDAACASFPMPDLSARLDMPLEPPRLGRLRGLFQDLAQPPVQEMMDTAASRFAEERAVIEEVALPVGFGEVLDRHRKVMAVEAASFHGSRLRRHPEDYQPKISMLLEEGLACPAAEYARCKEHQAQLRADMMACCDGFDALLTPATTGPAPDLSSTGDPAFNSPWSYTGLPTVCLPAGRSPDGMPLAIQLVGRPWGEENLFAAAAWCEKALGWTRSEPPMG